MNKASIAALFCLFTILLCGCCGFSIQSHKYGSSVMDYLYPKEQVTIKPSIPTLSLPIKVGIAFVPEKGRSSYHSDSSSISEKDKTEAIELVRQEFAQYDFIDSIQIIPSAYLLPQGGFDNLSLIGQMFDIDVAILLSYDQIQHTNENMASIAYLTIVGTYFIPGDRNDTHTMVDATVYHIDSRKLLFRAPGMSQVKSLSTFINLDANQRNDRYSGFKMALQNMIPNLKCELEQFKLKMSEKPEEYEIVCKPGYTGGGAIDFLFLALALGMLIRKRRLCEI